jgi:hypothetical protein
VTKSILFLSILLFSATSFGAIYMGGNYGYTMFSSDSLKDYKVSSKGPAYGGFIGLGKDFVGLEAFYQSFTAEGDIEHDGEGQTLQTNATAMGAALRFSFQIFYARIGIAKYTLDQSTDIEDDESRAAADEIYDVQDKGSTKSGVLYGLGLHRKFSKFTGFIDYSRYQINTVGNYDTYSIGISFVIPDRWFSLGNN